MYYSIVFIAALFIGFQITYVVDSSFMLDFFLNQTINNDQSLIFANNFMIYQISILMITVIGCYFMKNKNIVKNIVISIIVTLLYLISLIGILKLRYNVFLETLLFFTMGILSIVSFLYWYDFIFAK